MPKDNEVDEKVMPDSEARAPATLSWIQQRELIRAALCKELDTDIEDSEPTYTIAMRAANALHWRQKELEEWRAKANDHAATVAELRAEVEKARITGIDACEKLTALWQKDIARADAAERRVGECLKFIDGIRDELHNRRTADWYPEGAHNAAAQMSEDMRLLGNACADFDPYTLTGADPT